MTARFMVQSPSLRRAAVLAIVVLAAAAGVAGTLMSVAREQVEDAPRGIELEGSSADHSRARTQRAPKRQAPASAMGSTRIEVTLASFQESRPRPVPRDTSAPPAVPQGASVSLPPTHLETGVDGLPASGLRCTYDGEAFQCGACRTDSDCPVGKGCVANRETRRFECMEPECEEDAHCFPGTVCRRVTREETGPIIRRCVPVGARREGESCDILFVSPAGGCQEGLICHRGLCSVPCRREDAASCSEGHVCEEGTDGAACFPDCRARGCPTGQRCKRLQGEDFQCLEQVQGECPETPCGAGERCNMRVSRGRGVFWCARLCDPLRADSCPAGQVCGVGGGTISTCYRRCDPMELDSCGEGQRCTTVSEDMTQWGCTPTTSARL